MPMKNNLPTLREMDKDRAREICRLGGLASQKKIREKKALREKMLDALAVCKEHRLSMKNLSAEERKLLEESDPLVLELFRISRSATYDSDKLKAIDMILDRIEGKAQGKLDVTSGGKSICLENLTDDELNDRLNKIDLLK